MGEIVGSAVELNQQELFEERNLDRLTIGCRNRRGLSAAAGGTGNDF